jgi:hypothetical protein
MLRLLSFVPRVALVVTGVLVGAASILLKSAPSSNTTQRVSHSSLAEKILAQETRFEARMSVCERRLDVHEMRLKEAPTTAQIVSAMEDLLSQTMNAVDQRLSDQRYSIESLKTTVSKSDELMERVLDSLYSLQDPVHGKPVPA